MKICVAGQGAFGQKHLDALKRIPEVEVTSLVGGNQDATAQVAKKYGVPHYKGELKVQQMDVQTYFFRRKNINAAGNPRSWTDHLLWHHAAHTIDLFQYQCGETISDCYAVQGPIHPQLNIAMDMGIVARVPSGAILT